MNNNNFSSLTAFTWQYSKKYWLALSGLFFIGLTWAIHFSISPTFIKLIIDAAASNPDHLVSTTLRPFLGYLGMALILLLISTLYDYLFLKVFPHLRADLIQAMHSHLLNHSYQYFQTHLAGTLSNKISDLSKGIISILTSLIDDFFSRSLLFIFGVITLLWVHPLFAVTLVIWVVLFMTLSYFLSKQSERLSIDFSESRSYGMGKVVDAITNIFNIKLFGTHTYEHGYLRKHLSEMVEKEKRLHWYMLKLKLAQSISITLLIVAMTSLLIYTRLQGLITLGDFALVLTLTSGIVDEVFYLALQFVSFSEELGVCKQALSILSKQPEALDLPSAKKLTVSRGEIVFNHVSFQFGNGRSIFKDLSLKISPGEKVGLVGLSGSGKSTIAHLLLRFYDVSAGQILIDGHDIAKVTRQSLSENIAMIPQDPILFHRSVYENILYGRLGALESDVMEAAQKAHCHSFILQMKEGYQTTVGERGVKLSGGQRQRLAIARAILKNAPILVLDEATSALDSFTEQQIQASLKTFMKGRTSIVIAHRLSTLFQMDRILVFESGKIIEEGTHEELLEKKGRYAQLWTLQAGTALEPSLR